ncbi:TetR/AcrR family transcriptional regulator [Streptomyces sp. NBC_01387]|uniref:TetR/AcrR family transcriptional regulator n=1 Tax=unclassified Streptomyces TaxID=2593676 RepID=UPI00202516B2|nr:MULTISPECIES: TetR/AcrR family transcriptional regulator [unclassified Streptomyces]WSV53989.1 TetR/AcrR family transcriptional regulator [Streptomyces sp. NBC_01014]
MPAARESLLDSALSAVSTADGRPWSAVRMTDVASAAGVSRQTLYNEFGSKEGLARALVRREADRYLQGVDRVLAAPGASVGGEPLVLVAEWTVSAARSRPLVRALLTGCWTGRLPAPDPAPGRSRLPAQRRADAGPPAPGELIAAVLHRAALALSRGRADEGEEAVDLRYRCEVAVRLALSHVVAPGDRKVGHLVREAVGRAG